MQNETEVGVFTNPKTKPVVAKIYNFVGDYNWIVSEAVKPLGNSRRGINEFEKKLGYSFSFFKEVIIHFHFHDLPTENSESLASTEQIEDLLHKLYIDKKIKDKKSYIKQILQSDFIQGILYLIKEQDLLYGDLIKPNSYGISASDKIVLLDYGLTKTGYLKLY